MGFLSRCWCVLICFDKILLVIIFRKKYLFKVMPGKSDNKNLQWYFFFPREKTPHYVYMFFSWNSLSDKLFWSQKIQSFLPIVMAYKVSVISIIFCYTMQGNIPLTKVLFATWQFAIKMLRIVRLLQRPSLKQWVQHSVFLHRKCFF